MYKLFRGFLETVNGRSEKSRVLSGVSLKESAILAITDQIIPEDIRGFHDSAGNREDFGLEVLLIHFDESREEFYPIAIYPIGEFVSVFDKGEEFFGIGDI